MRVLRGFMSPRKSFEELAKINVANLVDYAVNNLHMDEADIVYATNTLLDMFRLTEPSDAPVGKYDLYETLSALSAHAVRLKLCAEEDRQLFETRIMGVLTPPPSKVIETFDERLKGRYPAQDLEDPATGEVLFTRATMAASASTDWEP